MLSASASSTHPLFSFDGGNGAAQDAGDTTGSYDFLPSVSFDDLQSSIESASTEFKLTAFPSPTGHGGILDSQTLDVDNMADKAPTNTQIPAAGRGGAPVIAPNRPGRSGSILRRPSTSSRQTSISSITAPSILDAPTAPAAMRNRRQSHYPPVSNAMGGSTMGKPPRKSIGPGVLDGDVSYRPAQKRRPSLISNGGSGTDSTRTSMDGPIGLGIDTTRNLPASRAVKARSIGQPLPRTHSTSLHAANTLTPEQNNRFSTAINSRSPRVAGRGTSAAPSSAQSTASQKRASVMPGMPHQSHATGLGARTISPTDTRRMKRMSMHQPQNMNSIADAPPPPPIDHREHSRSPSMIPRKASATPSSSRTTPDINRKSYSSGLSVGSSMSFNTVRTSTGSGAQPRIPVPGPASRLPAPKSALPHTLNNTTTAEEDEDVPPVPAIPKAYESPKEPPIDSLFLDKRKVSLAADASSINSNSTGSFSIPSGAEQVRVGRKASTRKSTTAAIAQTDKKVGGHAKKQPPGLSLPPLMVGPLNPSTAAKVAALQDHGHSDRNLSPPPSRIIAKTPTTPMTASKSSFFSRHRHDDKTELPPLRSSSTVHHNRVDSASGGAGSSSDSFGGTSGQVSRKPSMSPFLSSSVPKHGPDHDFIRRAKTGDISNLTEPTLDVKSQQKPSGPRAQKPSKSRAKSPPPMSDPEEPPTPSSMSSLRRKLSLSWKRGASKNGNAAGPAEKTEPSVKPGSMPPPRIPVSATAGNLASVHAPSPSTSLKSSNTTYLESRRRKSSASSLNTFGHDRTKSENWTQNSGSVKKPANDSGNERQHPARTTSVMNKILRPKASSATVRSPDPWTADLDKDDMVAEDEMKKMGSRRKETEIAARTLDALRKRATPKERVGAHEAIRIAMLNIYERGEIVDYNDVYFCGTQNAQKVVGNLQSDLPNFGYDDERGDYTIVSGDHLAYRYEIVDILGKGSFGQVVRCIDHKTGALVAVKIIRNKKRFHQQALVEVNILQKLREWVR